MRIGAKAAVENDATWYNGTTGIVDLRSKSDSAKPPNSNQMVGWQSYIVRWTLPRSLGQVLSIDHHSSPSGRYTYGSSRALTSAVQQFHHQKSSVDRGSRLHRRWVHQW